MLAPADTDAGSTSEELEEPEAELDDPLAVLRGLDWRPPSPVDAAILDALPFDFDLAAEPLFADQQADAAVLEPDDAIAEILAFLKPQGSSVDAVDAPGASGAAVDAAEVKRARRSAIEKRSRQRRQGALKLMRSEVKDLESRLLKAKRKRARALARQVPGASLEELQTRGPTRSASDVQRVTAQFMILAQALEDEHLALQRLLREHELFHKAVLASGYSDLVGGDVTIDRHGVPDSSSFTAKFRRMVAADCYAFVRESYDTLCRLDRNGRYESFGTAFMGWTDKRRFDEQTSALNYGFTKRFPHESAEELLFRTWDAFRKERLMARLSFHTSVHVRFEVIQRINDDVEIIRMDHKQPGMDVTFLTVYLLFRVQTPTGYTQCMRTVPSPEIMETLEGHEIYFDVFHWSHFNILRDELGNPAGCEVVAGGYIGDPSTMISKYWLFELILSVLRWENMCVSPLFLVS